MKKGWFWFFYLLGICIVIGLLKNTFTEKEAVLWVSDQDENYGFTIQVENHLGEALQGVSFHLYEYRDSSAPLRYLDRLYISGEESVETSLETSTHRNGILHFYGLKEGVYYLEETAVPNGYRVLENRITIKVDEKSTEDGVDYYIVNGALK